MKQISPEDYAKAYRKYKNDWKSVYAWLEDYVKGKPEEIRQVIRQMEFGVIYDER